MDLFSKEKIVGVFRGFSESGLEFCADLSLPYKSEFQNTPMHGQFLLVQLETPQEAVLGRITSISSQGRMSTEAGEDYGIRAFQEDREVDEDLRSQYLKYKTNIRILGVVRTNRDGLVFAASHRRLPHVGSKVAFLSDEVLKWVANDIEGKGADLGFLAFGEFIHGGSSNKINRQEWMQVIQPEVVPKFDISHLISRRTFVFARAGYGKSNLVKLLFSNLYNGDTPPTTDKSGGRKVPVGTVIFDPDGEYFWPDDKGRPGLCDVPHLQDKIIVFTDRQGPSDFYHSFVAGKTKLDIRDIKPAQVVSIALPTERMNQQNVQKLRNLIPSKWEELVDLIYAEKMGAKEKDIADILGLKHGSQDNEILAAKGNMVRIVNMLHDPSCQLLGMLIDSLRQGKICVVDISGMRGDRGLALSGVILQEIFNNNQKEFTKRDSKTIPTIAVVEEAQSVLSSSGTSGDGPYVTWVKEGRKYDLGAVLITQQPKSIPDEVLSQGDNWFAFHLLSQGDLKALQKANAHFSQDILSSLLNEPLRGHGIFWSGVSEQSYPIPVRAMSFESMYTMRDPDYSLESVETSATKIKKQFQEAVEAAPIQVGAPSSEIVNDEVAPEESGETKIDVMKTYKKSAMKKVMDDFGYRKKLESGEEVLWIEIQNKLEECLGDVVLNKNEQAYKLLPQMLNQEFGRNAWDKKKSPHPTSKRMLAWVFLKEK